MRHQGGDEEDEKKEEPRREEFVETPPHPEPVWEETEPFREPSRDLSLEDRIEALEEGQVQPRTGVV
jgi:hypothetical protein